MKKTYFLLELDSYGQPNGIITNKQLTREEYNKIKKERGYIYEDYMSAYYRSLD